MIKIFIYIFVLVFSFFSLIANANQVPKIELEKNALSLQEQIITLISDFNKTKKEFLYKDESNTKDIDASIDEFLKSLNLIKQQLDEYEKTKDPNKLKAAAYTIDLLQFLVTEESSTIPNEKKLDTQSLNFEKLDTEGQEFVQAALQDINSGKISDQQNVLYYIKEIQSSNYNIESLLKSTNITEVGFKELNTALQKLELDSLNFEDMDLETISSTFEVLEQTNIEQITERVSQSIEQTAEAIQEIQEVTEDVFNEIWNIYSVSDVVKELNAEINTMVWVQPYMFGSLFGIDEGYNIWDGNLYQGEESWAQAVEKYNQVNGTNYTEEEALAIAAGIVCFYGDCKNW
jgi:hypothetical protein